MRKNKKEHLFDSAIYGIINHDINHVHVMFCAQPRTELSKFINAYKSASSRLLKKEYPEIRKKLWKEAFWSQSFCLLTDGGTPVEVIRQYIESQGVKSIEHSISFPNLSDRRTEDTSWQNIWLLSFSVQSDA